MLYTLGKKKKKKVEKEWQLADCVFFSLFLSCSRAVIRGLVLGKKGGVTSSAQAPDHFGRTDGLKNE